MVTETGRARGSEFVSVTGSGRSASAFWRVVWGSLQKNWKLSISYPSWILSRLLGPFVWVSLAVYAYLGLVHAGSVADAFEREAGTRDFTGFLILGQTMFSFFTSINWRGGMAIERERWYGTFELIMLAPTSRVAFLLGESLFGLIDQGWTIFLAMIVASFLFGIDFSVGDPLLVVVTLALTMLTMVALGVFFAGFYVLTRSAGPMSYAVAAPVRFLAGVQFPVTVLPLAVQAVSYAVPVTYGLIAVRAVLLADATWIDLAPILLGLAGMAIGLFMLGIALVAKMERVAKQRGTLHEY